MKGCQPDEGGNLKNEQPVPKDAPCDAEGQNGGLGAINSGPRKTRSMLLGDPKGWTSEGIG